MLSLWGRQRLKVTGEALPLSLVAASPLRATDWAFTLAWSAGTPPRTLKVDDIVIRQSRQPDPAEKGAWHFHLPPTVHGLARIEAESFAGERCIGVVETMSGYQLPEPQLRGFLEWMRFYREVQAALLGSGGISSLDLIDDVLTASTHQATVDEVKEDIPPETRAELSELFDQVLKSPLCRLIDEKQLVDPGEIQRVSPATVDYFIRHPETWHMRSRLRPRPVKLLDDRTEEDFDVYENRFVVHFLEELRLRLEQLVSRDKLAVSERELRVAESVRRINLGLFEQRQDSLDALVRESAYVRHNLEDMQRFRNTALRLRDAPMFARVRSLSSAPRANTTLLIHPVYGRLYEIYQQINQEAFAHKRLQWLEEAQRTDLHSIYLGYCFLIVLRALRSVHFDLAGAASLPIFRGDRAAPLEFSNLAQPRHLVLRHRFRPRAQVTVSLQPLADLIQDQALVLEFSYRPTGTSAEPSKAIVWLVPEPTWWGDTSLDRADKVAALNDLYERLLALHPSSESAMAKKSKAEQRRRRRGEIEATKALYSVILLHPTSPSDFDDRLDYMDIRHLLNQGDNLVSQADYKKFGGYAVGVLPIYPSDEGRGSEIGAGSQDAEMRSLLRLQRLIRVQLFRVGLDDLCWNCFGTAQASEMATGRKQFACSNSRCRLRWGEVMCPRCGHRYVKMKFPSAGTRKLPIASAGGETPVAAVMIAEALEGRLAVSSVCESLEHADDFWAICPYCGHCEKEAASPSCQRCQARRAPNSGNHTK